MKPTIYFNEEPCKKAKEILLEYFELALCYGDVVWTGLKPFSHNKVIVTPCTGTNHVQAKTIIHLDDEFKETEGKLVTSTAEHTLSLMLQLAKKAKIQLSGKVLGIIGYGRIGSMVADYCSALGMKILTYDINREWNSAFFDELIQLSDVISIHIPLDGNYRFIKQTDLDMMKKNVLLINTSRRDVVDWNPIVVGCSNIKIWYADDFYNKNDDFITSNRFISTPHIAGNSIEAREITDIWLANKLIKYWRSKNQ